MQRQIADAMQAEIQHRAREAGEKLYRKQQELQTEQKRQEEIKKIGEIGYMDEMTMLVNRIRQLFIFIVWRFREKTNTM